jgi:hypothetical protein
VDIYFNRCCTTARKDTTMRRHDLILSLSLLTLLSLAGCGGNDDSAVAPATPLDGTAGVVQGDFAAAAATFEFTSVVELDRPDRPAGPFRIRGRVTGYDSEVGALIVELTVVNAGERTYPEPVDLTFVRLLPAGVTVLEADNGEDGVGASFRFAFANDDAMWTPGEESFPRTIQFVVAAGTAIGFAARIDVGMPAVGGAIGGLVWDDTDEDGIVDDGEAGIGGVGVRVEAGPDHHWLASTAADGTYRVDGLPAGFYTVVRLPHPRLRATTAPQLQVALVADDGGVSDFLAANFGCRAVADSPDIAVGDCLHAKGAYVGERPRLVASIYCPCDADHEDDDDDSPCWDRLTGPVTDVAPARRAVAIMGTWLQVADERFDLERVAVGDRLRASVRVVTDDDGRHLEACRLHTFNGHFDRIRGVVQEVILDDGGEVVAVVMLGARVELADAHLGCDD